MQPSNTSPLVTIVLPISRRDYLKPVFDCLNTLYRPDDTEIIILVDGDQNLERAIESKVAKIDYQKVSLYKFGDGAATNITDRRQRISDIHNVARCMVPKKCRYVFSIEDDTVYPPETLAHFIDTFERYETAGFVEGIQLGRWATPYVGGWIADDIVDVQELTSILPTNGVQEIDAGGLYCALIDADLYRTHQFRPFDSGFPKGLSCDVNFGISIRRMGYKVLANWDILCDHIGERGSVNLGNTEPVIVKFDKLYGNWNVETIRSKP